MGDTNFDLKGFLNSPQAQADKPGAIKYLQSKGIIDSLGNVIGQAPKPVAPTPPDSMQGLPSLTKAVTSIFPGGKVGQAIGTAGGLLYEKAKGLFGGQDNSKFYDTSAPSPLQVAGDIGQGILTIAAPNVGRGATALGRIGANVALGAGIGGTNALAEGQSAPDVAKSAAIGGAIGGSASAASEGLAALTKNLPNWLTKMALPKIDNKNIPYALQNTKIAPLKTLQAHSETSLANYEDSIQSILSHPEFKAVAENTQGILASAAKTLPNSNYTAQELIDNASTIAPNVSRLLDKFQAGQADIQEINTIRKELDAATKSVYTSINRPPEAKLLGATLSNAMRDYVQTNAPATQPIFANYAKEIGLNKAIDAAVKKGEAHISLGDIAAGVGGFAHSGFQGALEAIIAERVLRNPTAQLGAAKLIQKGASVAAPVAKTVAKGAVAPLIKKATNSK